MRRAGQSHKPRLETKLGQKRKLQWTPPVHRMLLNGAQSNRPDRHNSQPRPEVFSDMPSAAMLPTSVSPCCVISGVPPAVVPSTVALSVHSEPDCARVFHLVRAHSEPDWASILRLVHVISEPNFALFLRLVRAQSKPDLACVLRLVRARADL